MGLRGFRRIRVYFALGGFYCLDLDCVVVAITYVALFFGKGRIYQDIAFSINIKVIFDAKY